MATKLPSITAKPDWNKAQMTAFERLDSALPVAMSYLSGEIPVMDNHTDEMLVDEVGDLKKAKKLLETAEKAHVELLKVRMNSKERPPAEDEDGPQYGVDNLRGDIYEAKYRGSKRTILNQGLCKDTIEAFDEEGIHIQRLLAAIKAGQIQVPENVVLKPEAPNPDGGVIPGETNFRVFHTTADGGRSLYVEPIV
jgi:hypothetical protein